MAFTRQSRETIQDLGFIKLMKNTVHEDTTDTTFERFCIDHVGACIVIPLMENGDIILIDQYRHAVDSGVLEVVAGRLDPEDKAPIDAAGRELFEEVGVRAKEFIDLGSWLVSPGWTNEINYAFVGIDCDEPVDPEPDGLEEQLSTPVRMPLELAMQMVKDGEINDGKSMLLIQKVYDYVSAIS